MKKFSFLAMLFAFLMFVPVLNAQDAAPAPAEEAATTAPAPAETPTPAPAATPAETPAAPAAEPAKTDAAAPVAATTDAAAPAPAGDGLAAEAKWYAGHAQEKYLSVLDPMVDNAMEGYNKEDYKIYFKDFAASMAAVATEQTFSSMVLGMWKKDAGEFKSKKLIDERCSFNDTTPLLVYEGEFANKKMDLAVNFIKEGDAFKVMQVTIQAPAAK
jgi:hypothetical protein